LLVARNVVNKLLAVALLNSAVLGEFFFILLFSFFQLHAHQISPSHNLEGFLTESGAASCNMGLLGSGFK
jgi:hypothetical protein